MGVDLEILKERFLRADSAMQLESLALNLVRIQAFVSDGSGELVCEYLVRESQFLIEWMVEELDVEANLEQAVELADLQRLLSRWKLGRSDWWGDEERRLEVAGLVQEWCDRISQKQVLVA